MYGIGLVAATAVKSQQREERLQRAMRDARRDDYRVLSFDEVHQSLGKEYSEKVMRCCVVVWRMRSVFCLFIEHKTHTNKKPKAEALQKLAESVLADRLLAESLPRVDEESTSDPPFVARAAVFVKLSQSLLGNMMGSIGRWGNNPSKQATGKERREVWGSGA